MSILVTSTSKIKLDAIKEVFDLDIIPLFQNVENNPSQPFGLDDTGCTAALVCAINRLKSVSSNHRDNPKVKYIVSIENGVIDLYKNGILFDICDVALIDTTTKELITTRYFTNHIKVSIPNPNVYLSTIKNNSTHSKLGFSTTFGSLIAKDFSTSSNNWMETFGVRRTDQIIASLDYIKSLLPENLQKIKANIRTIKNYPQENVLFQDMFSLFESFETLDTIISKMADICSMLNITKVTGPELRGCMLGVLVAQKMKLSFVPIRKKGKLPPPTIEIKYIKEYGEDIFELNPELFSPTDTVLIIDDVLATGGSLKACIDLVSQCCSVKKCILLTDVHELRKEAQTRMELIPYTVLL